MRLGSLVHFYPEVQEKPVPWQTNVKWNVTVEVIGSTLVNYTLPSDYIYSSLHVYNRTGDEISVVRNTEWVAWNGTYNESNYTITFETPNVTVSSGTSYLTKQAKIGEQPSWQRTDGVTNPSQHNYQDIELRFTIPSDTVYYEIYNPDGYKCPVTGSCSTPTRIGDYIRIYANVSTSSKSWTIKYNTSAITYTTWNETVDKTWNEYINVSKNVTNVPSVYVEIPVNEFVASFISILH